MKASLTEPADGSSKFTITAVAAMSKNRVIGSGNSIPWHIPEDFAHFKKYTLGKTLLMGRRTFESIGRPLSGRRTVVLTRDSEFSHPGVTVVKDFEELESLVNPGEEVVLAGGGSLYQQFLKDCSKVVLSVVELTIDGDAYFPELDSRTWSLDSVEYVQASTPFRVEVYSRAG